MQDNGPFALAKANVAGRELLVFRHGARTLPEVYRKAIRAKDAPFLVNDHACVSHAALYRQATAYAALFCRRGIRRGMHVALTGADEQDWIASFMAVTSLGAVAVLGADLMECDATIGDQAPQAAEIVITASELAAATATSQPLPAIEIHPDMDACIAFTSGSSGMPKGAILTHRGLTTGLMNMMLAGMAARDTTAARPAMAAAPSVLLRAPLNHISGIMQLLLMFLLGGKVVRSGRQDFLNLIGDHRITSVTGISDAEMTALLDAHAGVASLRSIAPVGRALAAPMRHALRQRRPDLGLGSGYGLTETCGLVCAIGNRELDARPQAVGYPLPTTETRILDGDGRDCAPGEAGAIWLRGAMLMRGYCNRPDHRMPDGWFATGDVGFMAQDGMLHVLDKEDRFLRAGRGRISCRDIEETIRQAYPLDEVAALPLTGDEGGDGLLIVLTDSRVAEAATLGQLLASRFPVLPQPRFAVRETLPRTGSGKIAYSQLLSDIRS